MSMLMKTVRHSIRFIDKVDIPDEISKIKIGNLVLYGKVTKEEIGRIKACLLYTSVLSAIKQWEMVQCAKP